MEFQRLVVLEQLRDQGFEVQRASYLAFRRSPPLGCNLEEVAKLERADLESLALGPILVKSQGDPYGHWSLPVLPRDWPEKTLRSFYGYLPTPRDSLPSTW